MTKFGPLKTTHQVENVIEQFIRRWVDYYLGLAEVATEYGPAGTIARPAQYFRRQILRDIPRRDLTPAIILRTTGTPEDPRRRSSRSGDPTGRGPAVYDVTLDFGVGVLCYGTDQEGARENAALYGAALAALFLQRAKLDGALDGDLTIADWHGIRLDDLPPDDQQTRAIVALTFDLSAKSFLQTLGPTLTAPPPEGTYTDPGPWPTVAKTKVTVKQEGE